MIEHEILDRKLKAEISKRKILNYRLETRLSKEKRLGFTGKSLGGTYNPITDSRTLSGSVLVEWPDNKVSKSNVEGTWLQNFDHRMSTIYNLRYSDPSDRNFPEPDKTYKKSLQCDSNIDTENYSFETEAISRISTLQKWMIGLGEEGIGGSISIGSTERASTNSAGSNYSQTATRVNFSGELGDTTYFSMNYRSLEDLGMEKEYLNRMEKVYNSLKYPRKLRSMKIFVLLTPDIFQELFDYFILGNIEAPSIYYNQSCFTIDDFAKRKMIGPQSLDIKIYPKRKMTRGAWDFSSEGMIYPESYQFASGGKLITPICNLRFSKLLHIPPTPPITSLKLVDFGESEESRSFEEITEIQGRAVMVQHILGLHTQDSGSGNFALVSPFSGVIENGIITGSANLMIRGNMFNIIKNLEKIYRDQLTGLPFIVTDDIEIIQT